MSDPWLYWLTVLATVLLLGTAAAILLYAWWIRPRPRADPRSHPLQPGTHGPGAHGGSRGVSSKPRPTRVVRDLPRARKIS